MLCFVRFVKGGQKWKTRKEEEESECGSVSGSQDHFQSEVRFTFLYYGGTHGRRLYCWFVCQEREGVWAPTKGLNVLPFSTSL